MFTSINYNLDLTLPNMVLSFNVFKSLKSMRESITESISYLKHVLYRNGMNIFLTIMSYFDS